MTLKDPKIPIADDIIKALDDVGYVIVAKEPTAHQVNAAYTFMLENSATFGYDQTDAQKIERTKGVYRAMVKACTDDHS